MPSVERDSLAFAEQLMSENKIAEALQMVESLEQQQDLTAAEMIECALLKSKLLVRLRRYEETIKLTEQIIQKSQKTSQTLSSIDAYITMTEALLGSGRFDEGLKIIARVQQTLKAIKTDSPKGLIQREAELIDLKGLIYRQKGDLDKALDCFQQSLELKDKTSDAQETSDTLFNLVAIAVDRGAPDLARVYLQRLQEIRNQSKLVNQQYRVAKALLLKTNERIRTRGEAEILLTQVLEEEIIDYQLTTTALLHLSNLLMIEMQDSGDKEILKEIEAQINLLYNIALQQRSHSLLVETYLLQSKLALMKLDLKSAQRLLVQAQVLAEEKGLQRLAWKTSLEYDTLLDQYSKWQSLIERRSTLRELADLAQIEELVLGIIRKQVEDETELAEEEPVLLVILEKGGESLFSKLLDPELDLNDELVGGFLSGINASVSDIFSKSLDRARLGEHTLLMRAEEPLLVCYIFKGKSYSAQRKLAWFIDSLKENPTWQRWQKFNAKDRSLTQAEQSTLEDLVTRVFLRQK